MQKRIKRIFYNNIYVPFQNKVTKPNKEAIWVFGFQKAGTTAIASLLAHRSGCSVAIDPRLLWFPYGKRLREGTLSVKDHVNKYSYPFSKDIIKEPSTTFYIDKIASFFTLDRYVFIIRNPYANIRSILNRLDLPGDQQHIDMEKVHPSWRNKFANNGQDYVSDLAQLWLRANDQDTYMVNGRCVLVKYEEFNAGKEACITSLCEELHLPAAKSINEVMDTPFQPRGRSNVDLKAFFGGRNISVIDQVCGDRMNTLGYNKQEILASP